MSLSQSGGADIPMRNGIFLPPLHAMDRDPTEAMQRDLELIEWLDRLGFEEGWVGEHHSGGYEIISSPELFIAAAAERTKRIKLGTGVISLPYHNPLMVANRMIQLDHQTRGRVMFGVGPGLLGSDASMLGISQMDTRDRMAESLWAILRLLNGETVTETTDWYTLVKARIRSFSSLDTAATTRAPIASTVHVDPREVAAMEPPACKCLFTVQLSARYTDHDRHFTGCIRDAGPGAAPFSVGIGDAFLGLSELLSGTPSVYGPNQCVTLNDTTYKPEQTCSCGRHHRRIGRCQIRGHPCKVGSRAGLGPDPAPGAACRSREGP